MTTKELEVQIALGTLSIDDKEKLTGTFSTPKKILTILSTDKDWYVRWNVAKNPNTPKKILTILSTDEDWGVRCRVAENPNTSIDILKKLSIDKNENVRYWVTKNLNTPKEVLIEGTHAKT